MSDNEYLTKVLDKQKLEKDGDEIKKLRERRDEIEAFLRERSSLIVGSAFTTPVRTRRRL